MFVKIKKFINERGEFTRFAAALYILLIASVHFLIFDSGGYTNITIVKYISFCTLSGIYIASMLAYGVIKHGRKLPKRIAMAMLNMTAVQKLVLFYAVFTVISAFVSPYFPYTLGGISRYEGAVTICLYCLVFLLISKYGKTEKIFLYVFGAAVSVFCVVCIIQFTGANFLHLYPRGKNYYDAGTGIAGQFMGTIGNSGLGASVLCIAFPTFVMCLARLKGKKRFFLAIPLLLCTAVLIKARIAAALLGIVAGMFFCIPFAFKMKRSTRRILILMQLAAAVLSIILIRFFDFNSQTLHEVHELLNGRVEDSFGSGRIFIWRHVIELIPERPVFGGGPDSLIERMTVEFRRWSTDGGLKTASIDVAHNEYLNILVCQGIPALSVYAAAQMLLAIKYIGNAGKKTGAAICGMAVACYCVQAFFGISMCINSPFFWISWGLFESKFKNEY